MKDMPYSIVCSVKRDGDLVLGESGDWGVNHGINYVPYLAGNIVPLEGTLSRLTKQ